MPCAVSWGCNQNKKLFVAHTARGFWHVTKGAAGLPIC